ncbi:MAG TPA: hypothetical protein VKB77_07445 [Terriglobales bacterium]|nr:hypothetical protein [Terriglobales bacterium]
MPRRKLTEQEIDDAQKRGRARIHYLADHPEERAREMAEHEAKVEKKQQANVRQHQPVVTDISYNGEFAQIQFTRNNGERVTGIYQLTGWAWAPATIWDRLDRKARKFLEKEKAAAPPPPDPAETPRS